MFSKKLLEWYATHKRDLPWRTKNKNPYYIWLSEIMLQQTTVATVIPYFFNFIKKWPTLQDLAMASQDEILTQWQGLGYYSRARNLHQCAKILSIHFPSTEKELLKLPGIGPYTAGAIASIAFDASVAAVDGNVVRVISRYFTIGSPKPIIEVRHRVETLLPQDQNGDFTQALMELGALICRPKNPQCCLCPLQKDCKASAEKRVENFPEKKVKQALPFRHATAFILRREDGAILLRKRPAHGLLGGMMEIPSTKWEEGKNKNKKYPIIKHTFTHFHLEMNVQFLNDLEAFDGIWVYPKDFNKYALPTLMKKIIKVGLDSLNNSIVY